MDNRAGFIEGVNTEVLERAGDAGEIDKGSHGGGIALDTRLPALAGFEAFLWISGSLMVPQVSFKVKAYAAENRDFPDQSTADRFFDEPQFESYRELGFRVTAMMLDAPAPGRHKTSQAVAPEDRLEAFIRNIQAA